MIMCPVKCLSVADMSSCPLSSTLIICLHPPDTTVSFHTSTDEYHNLGQPKNFIKEFSDVIRQGKVAKTF